MLIDTSVSFTLAEQTGVVSKTIDITTSTIFDQRVPVVLHIYNPSTTCDFTIEFLNKLDSFGGADRYSLAGSIVVDANTIISKVIGALANNTPRRSRPCQ